MTSKKLNLNAVLAMLVFITAGSTLFAQSPIVNYDFNSGSSYPSLAPVLANDISCSVTGTETFATFGGTASGTSAFIANTVAGNALAMNNSSGTNEKYWTFQIGGSNLAYYKTFKAYFQAKRSSAGAQVVSVAYSNDGINYTTYGTTLSLTSADVFYEQVIDLSNITAINNQSNLYIKIMASGGGTGTLRLDNFQIQAVSDNTPDTSGNNNIGGWSLTGNSGISETENFIGTTDVKGLLMKTNNTDRMFITSEGNVGIGTNNPKLKLQVNGGISVYSPNGNNTGNTSLFFGQEQSTLQSPATEYGEWGIQYMNGIQKETGGNGWGGLNFWRPFGCTGTTGNYFLFLQDNGSIGIGTGNPNPNYKLDVAGRLRANEIVVNTTGADFVFDNNYQLMSLNELEKNIKENKHLPGIPSADEMQDKGMSIGETSTIFLQKIEELTLYLIEQNKLLEAQQQQINELEKKISLAK